VTIRLFQRIQYGAYLSYLAAGEQILIKISYGLNLLSDTLRSWEDPVVLVNDTTFNKALEFHIGLLLNSFKDYTINFEFVAHYLQVP
jgi:hypothetical protein